MRCTENRAVITGMGIIAPNGNSREKFWNSLLNGISGIAGIKSFDTSEYTTKIAGEIKNFDPLAYFDASEARHIPRYAQFAIVAAKEAISDAGITIGNDNAQDMGLVIGVSINALEIIEEQMKILIDKGPKKLNPFTVSGAFPNAAVGFMSVALGIKGRAMTISTGCSSSLNALGHAFELIKFGKMNKVLCGGADAPITPSIVGAFCASRSLSKRNDDPGGASRPFEMNRDGYILSEGSAIFVMEELNSALKRNAKIYAEVIGYGNTSEAMSMYKMDDTGNEAARTMNTAIADSGIHSDEIDYISAHGSSSQVSDVRETRAIKMVLGTHSSRIKISSIKSMVGHPLGLSGGFQTAATILAGNSGYIPPTINYQKEDPLCDLDYVPNESIRKKINIAVVNSFGMGGNNASMVLRVY
jgi:3-oxoacyl-[acyl-carrier-protein] synthase II